MNAGKSHLKNVDAVIASVLIDTEHPPLLARTREINELNRAPDGSIGCKDRQLLEGLLEVARE